MEILPFRVLALVLAPITDVSECSILPRPPFAAKNRAIPPTQLQLLGILTGSSKLPSRQLFWGSFRRTNVPNQ